MTKRRLLGFVCCLAALAAAMTIGVGCGTSCPEIAAQRRAFDERTRTSRGPDAHLALPYALLDRVLAGHLARHAQVPVELPTDKLGLSLSLSLALDRVTTHAAPAGRLGMTLHLSLVDRKTHDAVLALDVDTTIAPSFDASAAGGPTLAIALRPSDLGAARPHATPEGSRMLGRWLRDNLPPLVRALATDAVVQAVADECLDLVATHVWPHARDLLGSAPLVDARFALPDLPIRELALTSSGTALQAAITTDLPDAEPLPGGLEPASARLTLRMSGGTAMGLVNRAMARGEVPSRFDANGKATKDGAWEARVGWRGGPSPLVVHLWRLGDGCKSADVAARLALKLEGDTVHVDVADGRITSVSGPAFAEAFAWLAEIFGRAMAMTFDTAAFVRFEAGSDQVQLRLARIALGEADLTLDLDLGVAVR